ncbi:PTS sugar transporter subunit IIC [Acidaminobacter sp. JC074]|uniref:PTS transporter subunit IIC n=1 Tax=Acidaminobacter sp. JC074 TaxID=2530199 RepID=UPI001F0EF290|nr:PTS sugar transporter subunit IIC [Acidaminobacter sp. JC074]MCH4890985.1 PTS sugar transporter subunit IIC [Acidaminobacter sp. JC074]
MSKFKGFLKRKNIEISTKRYLITALSYMTYGLFSSLIIGSILNQIGLKLDIPLLYETIWPVARAMTGPAIAVAIAYGLEAPPLVIFASTLTGSVGAALGGPVGAFVAAVVGTEFGKMVSKETRIDILVTPSVTIITGCLIGSLVGGPINAFMTGFGQMIVSATELHTLPMSIIVSVLMGMALTLPISSAAIGIMLGLSGLAAGAATAGCAAQMVGFAVISFKENGWSGFFSQGLGTSMLQMPNIVKNWRIWIPATLASAITGPIATIVFKLENTAIGSGMGTSGLVGQFGTVEAMEAVGYSGASIYAPILIVHFLLPMAFSLAFAYILRQIGWIKENDLKLEL